MNIKKNISLKPYNTFGIEVFANEFIEISTLSELQDLLPYLKDKKFIFLGGGSNVLFVKDYDGLVVLNSIKGIEVDTANDKYIVKAYSGEVWHSFVLWTLDRGYNGLENLSLIPGTVGAAPMQNIGAYGVEIKDVCIGVEAIDILSGELKYFTKDECAFGYRESVFKRELKNRYFIYAVYFELSLNHPIHLDYGAIREVLKTQNISEPTHKDVSNAIIEIRSSKLPNPRELGNAGSFFKNPVVSHKMAEKFLREYPNAPHYSDPNGVKIPAGWLIEQCGFKGYREGNVGSHKDQALVIVNYGNASGDEIYKYSEKIIRTVEKKFNFVLEREVNIIF